MAPELPSEITTGRPLVIQAGANEKRLVPSRQDGQLVAGAGAIGAHQDLSPPSSGGQSNGSGARSSTSL